jgi:hypothetical protein
MKTSPFFSILISAGFALLFLNSCMDNGPESEQERIEKILTSGDWSIRQVFYDSNQTERYKQASLSFKGDHVLDLSNGGVLAVGEWSVRESIKKFYHLQLSFSDSTLAAIAGDWKIVDYTKTDFRLEDAANPTVDLGTIKKASITKILQ